MSNTSIKVFFAKNVLMGFFPRRSSFVDTQISFEARRPIKIFAGILQWASLIVVLAGILNIFVPFGFPGWAMYTGMAGYFIGMLGGMNVTLFRRHR